MVVKCLMGFMELTELDLPTLAMLSGAGVSRLLLDRLAEAGHPGLRNSHGYVFQRLVAGEPTIGALAASLGITQQGASKQVRELEELGYVERRPDPEDRRAKLVVPTERGLDQLRLGDEIVAEIEARHASEIGGRKYAEFRDALRAVVARSATARS